jgi:hypothetical protein
MPAEHKRPDGSWAQGYYCMRCGAAGLNLYGSGHEKCPLNPELVKQLIEANKRK